MSVLLSCVRCCVPAALLYSSGTQTMWPCDLVLLKVTPGVPDQITLYKKGHPHTQWYTQCCESKGDNLVCVCVFVWSLLTLISQKLYCEFKSKHTFDFHLLTGFSSLRKLIWSPLSVFEPIQHECWHSSYVYSNMDRKSSSFQQEKADLQWHVSSTGTNSRPASNR